MAKFKVSGEVYDITFEIPDDELAGLTGAEREQFIYDWAQEEVDRRGNVSWDVKEITP